MRIEKFIVNVLTVLYFIVTGIPLKAQVPAPALVGYFQNWQDGNSPYIQLDQVDLRYNIVDVAFAVPHNGTDYQMEFIPDQVSQTVFISQIQTLQSQGQKVIISAGGATAPISLDNVMERDSFISTMSNIIETYNYDGLDIDFEGSSLSLSGGTISAPVDQPIINLIYAVRQIMSNYYTTHQKRLILTMAPETAFVQGGQSSLGGIWGAYLPVIDALRDSIEILHVQLYNSGSMYGIDGNIYTQGTADFIVAMTEAVIQGFNTQGGMFNGLPSNKIAVGLPACSMAAGGGFTDTLTVKSAIDYLRGLGPQPGSYTLLNANGYPDLRGMMTWSINWDAVSSCGNFYEYANNYENIFGTSTLISENTKDEIIIYPNPVRGELNLRCFRSDVKSITISIYNVMGEIIYSTVFNYSNQVVNVDSRSFSPGIYYIQIYQDEKVYRRKFVKQ